MQRQLSNYDFSSGANSSGGILARIDSGNFLFDNTGNISMTGMNNFGVIANGASTTVDIDTNISSTGDGNIVLYARGGGKMKYAGTIETNGDRSHGIVIDTSTSTLSNYSGGTVTVETSGFTNLGPSTEPIIRACNFTKSPGCCFHFDTNKLCNSL